MRGATFWRGLIPSSVSSRHLQRARWPRWGLICVYSQARCSAAVCFALLFAGVACAGPVRLEEADLSAREPAASASVTVPSEALLPSLPGNGATRQTGGGSRPKPSSDTPGRRARDAEERESAVDDRAATRPDAPVKAASGAAAHVPLAAEAGLMDAKLSGIPGNPDAAKSDDPVRPAISWTGGDSLQAATTNDSGNRGSDGAAGTLAAPTAPKSAVRDAVQFAREVVTHPMFWLVVALIAGASWAAQRRER